MTQAPRSIDEVLDDALAAMAAAELDVHRADEALRRGWAKVAAGSEARAGEGAGAAAAAAEASDPWSEAPAPAAPDASVSEGRLIRDCGEVRTLLPDLEAGRLAAGRSLLVEDHLGSCAGCRRELAALRGAAPAFQVPSGQAPGRVKPGLGRVVGQRLSALEWRPALGTRRRRLAAAGVLATAVAGLWVALSGAGLLGGSVAEVSAMDGPFFRVASPSNQALGTGATVRAGWPLRTGMDGNAVVRLLGGGRLELDARSEVAVDRGWRGVTVRLRRGRVLVSGGDEGLTVQTADARVASLGGAFTVNRGVKGTRVVALDGPVRVDGPMGSEVLEAGDQFNGGPGLAAGSAAAEVAWSRDAALYGAILDDVAAVGAEVAAKVVAQDPRTEARLLDAVPADTIVYVAVPNVVDAVLEGQQRLWQRLRDNPALGAQLPEATAAEAEGALDDVLARLRDLGGLVGDEIVVAWVPGAGGLPGMEGARPVLLAEVRDGEAARRALPALAAGLNAETGDTVLAIVGEGEASTVAAALYARLAGGILAIAPEAPLLDAVGGGAALDPAFRAVVDDAYADGVEWLAVADVPKAVLPQAASGADTDGAEAATALYREAGLLDAGYLVVEYRDGQDAGTQAVLTFDGPRQGMAAWLAEPGPMGTLDFVSGEAHMAAAFAVKDAAAMYDDLVAMLTAADDAGPEALAKVEEELGLSLRQDVAAAIGGEVAIALDGAVLPEPSWKVIIEVYDPPRLQAAIETVVDAVNAGSDPVAAPLALVTADASWGPVYEVTVGGDVALAYTYSQGYLIAGPRAEVLDRAIRYARDGYTLTRSQSFRDLLPTDGRTSFSAVWFQDLGPIIAPLARAGDYVDGAAAPGGSRLPGIIEGLGATMPPSLAYAYAEADRIVMASTGAGPLGWSAADFISAVGALEMGEAVQGEAPDLP
ncbi:MAG: FecR domain-containing protein [Anaerolineae bacterium]